MPSILAVCRVHSLREDAGSVGITAIDKRAVDGAVQVGEYGLYADVQADRKHHGGPTKAVYAYAQEDIEFWRPELGYELPAGIFGENLRTLELDVSGALIGERWLLGHKVVLEVSSPRTPCQTFARRLNEKSWVKRFTQAARPGAYLSVVTKGAIAKGDSIEVISRPEHGVSVARWFTQKNLEDARALHEAHSSGAIILVPEMLSSVLAVVQRHDSIAS